MDGWNSTLQAACRILQNTRHYRQIIDTTKGDVSCDNSLDLCMMIFPFDSDFARKSVATRWFSFGFWSIFLVNSLIVGVKNNPPLHTIRCFESGKKTHEHGGYDGTSMCSRRLLFCHWKLLQLGWHILLVMEAGMPSWRDLINGCL